jgi:glycosyltransferase involved in cell wall biosynthesis
MGGRELALRHMFGQAYRLVHQDKPVDYVFLPYLDYCLYALGLLGSPFGSTQWGGICMRPSFHYRNYGVIAPKPKLASVKQALFLKLLRSKTLKSVYTIDELLPRFVAEQHPQWEHRLKYVPDPAELEGSHTYESARRELGIPDDAVVVLVYGAMNERKGLDVLVEALSSPNVSKTLHLLVVGKQSESIQSLMNSVQFRAMAKEERCHVINGFVSDAVQQMVFVASDIVWLGYRNHYSMSGVLVLAAISGKPVIATQDGLIGWYTRTQGLGISVDTKNLYQIVDALQSITSDTTVEPKINRQILGQHSWKQFFAVLNP